MGSYPISGKVALVTGGARGLGAATAHHLARKGARVVIADLDGSSAVRVASQLSGMRGLGLPCDVTDIDSVSGVVDKVCDEFGRIDVVIPNAGILGPCKTVRTQVPEQMAGVIAVNVTGVINTVAATVDSIIENRGQVVLISSVFAFVNGVGSVPYAMSKAAVEQFGRGLAVELAGHDASVLTAYFGLIDTDMIRNSLDASPVVQSLLAATAPPVLTRRISAAKAAAGLVRAIEGRRRTLVMPARWRPLSALRGVLNPIIDGKLMSDPELRRALNGLESLSDTKDTR